MGFFRRSFFTYDLKRLKHDPKAFLMVLEDLALPAEDCLFIDDNPENVQVAESVGIPSIRFRNAQLLRAELGRRA
jgi:HAD superfamily hydrolase (TIGR01509 family)